MPNNMSFFAINADDVPRARKFYEAVFGWDFEPWGPPGFYLIETGKERIGPIRGALQERRELAPGQKTIGFECTISVANIDGIVWPLAYPYGWGLISTVQLYDAAGTLLTEAVPTHTVTVHPYGAARIRPAGMVVAFGASVGTPYGMRRYGRGRYAREPTLQSWVDLIEIGFSLSDPCVPGVWTPADPCQPAAWECLASG